MEITERKHENNTQSTIEEHKSSQAKPTFSPPKKEEEEIHVMNHNIIVSQERIVFSNDEKAPILKKPTNESSIEEIKRQKSLPKKVSI